MHFGEGGSTIAASIDGVELEIPAFWEIIPTYTLQDILDKLPTLIIISSDFYKICIEPSCGYWDIYYYKSDATELISKKSENIIDAAYDMLCWCIENGYVEKEGK